MDSSFRIRKAHGFTLVELLVVIAIIGILIALLLPAVQAARSAARRTECVNKLKQLALGLHNYHDTFHNFPAGEITPGSCCGTQSFENWAISILPYIEQGNLYERYDFNQRNEHNNNRFVREANIDTHNCPSDINAGKLERPESGPGSGLLYRMSSYRAVGGATGGGGWWDNRQYTGAGGLHRAGVLHWVWDLRGRELRPEKMATVTDGTAYTLMLGEMATKTRPRRGTFWAYSYTSYNSSDVSYGQPRTLINDYNKCVSIGGAGGSNACKRGWGSFHESVVPFAMVDGSVTLVSKNIDMDILAAMATIGGAEVAYIP